MAEPLGGGAPDLLVDGASSDELDKVAEMRSVVGAGDTLCTDGQLLRFVRAREGDVVKALEMHRRWVDLREE